MQIALGHRDSATEWLFGSPATRDEQQHLTPKMVARFVDLGLDDKEIASKLGTEPQRVTALRLHLGL